MKPVAIENTDYAKLVQIADKNQTSLSTIMRQEMPGFIENIKNKEFPKMKYSKKVKEEAPAPQQDLVLENRSLMNLCFDLIELDVDAPENKEVVEQTFRKLGSKVDNYINLHTFAESQVDRLDRELDHLKKQINSFKRIQDILKSRALLAMKTLNVKELKSDTGHKMQIRKSDSVRITKLLELPNWAVTTTTTTAPNKLKIRKALKDGEIVTGAELEQNEYVYFK